MSLVTVPAGNFTPGALAALQFSAALINTSWEQANAKATAFESKVDGVEGVIAAGIGGITADSANTAAVAEPNISIPSGDLTGLALSTFTSKYQELVTMLSDKFVDFRTTYFPNESEVYNLAETWLSDAISNPNYAIPSGVAAQILTDASTRAYAEAATLSDAVIATFAARRFPLPAGAAAGAVLQINQKAQEVVAEADRKLMMAYVEQIQFAVGKALDLRQMALGAAVEYIKALAAGPALASQAVKVGYDAQSKLISAAASFYGARNDASKLVKQAEQFNATIKLNADEKNQAVDVRLVEERIKALMAEAGAIAQMASSMFNNLHSSSGTSYSVNGTN